MSFTRRGWVLFASTFAIIFAARMLGLAQLWVVATAVWLLLAGCFVWTQHHHVALVAMRDIPEHLHVGSIGRVDLTVVNQGSSGSPTSEYADQFDSGDRSARFALQPLAAGEQARAAYRVPTHRRGRFHLGPLIATIGDPFGLASRSWTAASSQEVIVHPRIFDVLALPELSGSGVDTESRDISGRPDTGGEFHTLRDYAASDDLRQVHWKSTARRGRLMVRQDESRRRAPVTVMLDTRAIAHNEASFEVAVEVTASIVTALARDSRPYEVITTAGDTLGQPGRRYLGSVLDELAVVEAHASNRVVPALRGNKSQSVVAVMGELHSADHAAVELTVQRGGGLALVLCNSSQHHATIARSRRLTIDLATPTTRGFVTEWNQAVLTWQQNATRQFSPAR